MQVKILNVDVEWNGTGAKKWGKAVVTYDYQGNPRKQNLMSFTNPAVFKEVQTLVGQTVEVETTKNDKNFTEWKSITVPSAGSANTGGSVNQGVSAGTTRVGGSNYETKEERAARQVLIVKQSSLSAAVATLTPGAKAALKPEEVLELAQKFTDWVFEQPKLINETSEDIPF